MDWQGGKYSGNYSFNGVSYIARLTHNYQGYQKHCKTEDEAEQWLMEKSIEFNMIKNKHRLIEVDGVQCVEVHLFGDRTFLCDVEDFIFVDLCVWHCKASTGTPYVYGTVAQNEKVIFHRLIAPWGSGKEWKQVDHINRNGLDNRRCNLRNGSGNINNLNQKKRTDNKTGIPGVHFCNHSNCWVVQWPEGGRRRKKTFRVCDNSGPKLKGNNHKLVRTFDEAKQMAINFRLMKNKELGLLNG